jgi:RecG-like helicase
MNFIDKDAVVATIKKHVQEERHSYFCKCLLSEIDALEVKEQPSLPDNLDEAELKYVESLDNPPTNQEEERIIYQTFKAGAEWMAKQIK